MEGLQNLDIVDAKELGKGAGAPEGLRGCFLMGNDVLVGENNGLPDCELANSPRECKILYQYKLKIRSYITSQPCDFGVIQRHGRRVGIPMGVFFLFSGYIVY